MGYVEKRSGEKYRARDRIGRKHSRSFRRKADAERFLLEMEADKVRGRWLDPRGAEQPLSEWVEEFLRLARRGGHVRWGVLRWGAGSWGLPLRPVTLSVESGSRMYGRFILEPSTAERLSLARRVIAGALADQAGRALAKREPIVAA